MITRRNFLKGFLGTAAAGTTGLYYAHDVVTGNYEIVDVPIKTKLLNENLYGLRVLIFSDPHIGAYNMTIDHLNNIVETINAQQPDVVLFAGDYVLANKDLRSHNNYTAQSIVEALAEVKAQKAAILGNHDINFRVSNELTKAFNHFGIPLLRNNSVVLETDKGPIWVAGMDNIKSRRHNYQETMKNVPSNEDVIFLTHNPDGFSLLGRSVALAVAGDTHCGQFIGRWFADTMDGNYTKTDEDWYCGEYTLDDESPAYVSGGIGTSTYPIRTMTPRSELLTLQPY